MAFSRVSYKGKTAAHIVINSLLVTFVYSENYTISGLNGWLPIPENTNGHQQDIVWNIEVPMGLRVALAFVEFDLEESVYSYRNCDSSLKIYEDDIELGTFYGKRESYYGQKDVVRSPSNILKVHFTSDCHRQYIGFKAYYYAEDIDECLDQNGGCEHLCHNVYGGFYCSCFPGYTLDSDGRTCTAKPRTTVLTESSGELDTGALGNDKYYPRDWIIIANSRHVIAVDFNAFHVIGLFACEDLFIMVYTGNEEFGPFCGNENVSNLPAIIQSANNVITIRYVVHLLQEGLLQAKYNIVGK
ncbi:mannan-binding lectin serine protease 1-like [Ptychodera flava]|uniref:mannan-binding lectin serine protease 1-like n=1 Tax=Ptychodera flava TaxID=63121 RepID=UPI00396A5168